MANLKGQARSRKQFKEFGCSEQGSVSLLKERMNRENSIRAISKKDYEMLKLELAFSVFREALIDEAQRYFRQTGSVMRLHLDGNGPKEVGYYNIDENGNLQTGKADANKTVYVYAVRNLQFLSIYPDTIGGIRFSLNASEGIDDISSGVVGFRKTLTGAQSDKGGSVQGERAPDLVEGAKSAAKDALRK